MQLALYTMFFHLVPSSHDGWKPNISPLLSMVVEEWWSGLISQKLKKSNYIFKINVHFHIHYINHQNLSSNKRILKVRFLDMILFLKFPFEQLVLNSTMEQYWLYRDNPDGEIWNLFSFLMSYFQAQTQPLVSISKCGCVVDVAISIVYSNRYVFPWPFHVFSILYLKKLI